MKTSLAHRLALLEAADPTQDWQHTQGLSSLLAYHRSLPLRDAAEVEEADVDAPGLAGLLAQARLWQREREREVDHGA